MPTAHEPIKRMAIICAIGFVALNVAFYLMAGSYFESHREIVTGIGSVSSYSPPQIRHIHIEFAVFAGVIAACGFVAGIWPRVVGHLIPVVFGAVNLVAGVEAFAHHLPGVLGATLLVSGVLMPVLAWHSYRHSRAAWAFLVAMCGVFAVVELFGAPKVRAALDLGLWLTMILPGINAVAVAALISLRSEYVERDITAARAPY